MIINYCVYIASLFNVCPIKIDKEVAFIISLWYGRLFQQLIICTPIYSYSYIFVSCLFNSKELIVLQTSFIILINFKLMLLQLVSYKIEVKLLTR